VCRWKPFDPARNWPDLGPRFAQGERKARTMASAVAAAAITSGSSSGNGGSEPQGVITKEEEDSVSDDRRDLDWATVLKRTFESYIRGERPNMYGEWLEW
jgi:DDB1- and CUL4-associated factor 13